MCDARTHARFRANWTFRLLLVVVLSVWTAHGGTSAQQVFSGGLRDQVVSERLPHIVAHPTEQASFQAEQKVQSPLAGDGSVTGILTQGLGLLPPDERRARTLPIRAPPHVGPSSRLPETRAPPYLI